MSTDAIDAAFVEERGAALAVRAEAPVAWVPTFAVAVNDMVARLEAKNDFFRRVMREGKDAHYGAISGADQTKKVLFKAGAELLLSSMGLASELSDAEIPVRDYGSDGREGMIVYRRICRIYKQTGLTENERMKVSQAEGACSSRESKYRWRNEKRHCPKCGKATIIAGKAEYGGGFICWKKEGKSDGCGAKFNADDPSITSQVAGKVPNPDLADVENTVLKMADKRALVAATLLATGCSDIFTMDVGDYDDVPDQSSETRDDERATRGPSNARSDASRGPVTSSPGGGSGEPGTRESQQRGTYRPGQGFEEPRSRNPDEPGSADPRGMEKIAEKCDILQSCTSFDSGVRKIAWEEATQGRLSGPLMWPIGLSVSSLGDLSEREARKLYKRLATIADDYARGVEMDRPGGAEEDSLPL